MTEKTFTLKRPLKKSDGSVVSEITLRQPTVGDLLQARKTEDNIDAVMISLLSGVHLLLVEKIAFSVFKKITAWIAVVCNTNSKREKNLEQITYSLTKTVNTGGNRYTQITLEEPCAGDFLKSRKATDTYLQGVKLIELVSGTCLEAVEALSIADYTDAMDFLADFM